MICRPATPDDRGFVAETFLRSFRVASTHAEGLTGDQCAALITNLIDKGWSATVVEESTYLIGWAVHGDKNRLAWMYLREPFREPKEHGIAKWLLREIGANPLRPYVSPFLANRLKRKYRTEHRPFLCLP